MDKTTYTKKIHGSCTGPPIFDDVDPFSFENCHWLLMKLGAEYVGKSDKVCRGSYVLEIPPRNVLLTYVLVLEPEFMLEEIFLEGESMKIVEEEEKRIVEYLNNSIPLLKEEKKRKKNRS